MAEATNPIATASNPRVGEDVGRGQRPHPFWYPLSKLEIAARGNRGAALTRDDVEALKSSLLGPLMAAAHAYGTSGASYTAAADPVIMPGAQVIASAPSPEAGAGGDLAYAIAAEIMGHGWALPDFLGDEDEADEECDRRHGQVQRAVEAVLARSGKLVASTPEQKEVETGASFGPGSHPSDQSAARTGGQAVSIPRADHMEH